MKKKIIIITALLILISCRTYKFNYIDELDTTSFRVDSIIVGYYPWNQHPRASIDLYNFRNYSRIFTTIKSQDSVGLIINELNKLTYKKEVCLCNREIRVYCRIYYVDKSNIIDDLESYNDNLYSELIIALDGSPIDCNWKEFKRSDKLIELLQLPPYPDEYK